MITKSKPKIPKCVWAKWRYCWQRHSVDGKMYFINPMHCAACIAARINWGDGASLRSLSKEEMLAEIGKLKRAKCANCGKIEIIVENGRCRTCQDRVDE